MLFKNLISSAYRIIIFSKRKTSLIIVTNTTLHFNDPGLSRPYKREVPCWQIFHIVGTFHATTANFTQRRITPRAQNKRKTATNKSEYSFQTQKSKTKALRPYEFVERRIILLRFSQKEQTSNKVYRFSDK